MLEPHRRPSRASQYDKPHSDPNPQPPTPGPQFPRGAPFCASLLDDRAAYEAHRRRFFDEYQPATPTESQLVQELIDTSWRLNRIPLLEADVLARAATPVPLDQEITFDIVDAHRLLANLSIQSQRLSRQFQKTLDTLRDIQAGRAELERRNLKDAAALLELHKHKGIPWDPAGHGFVFSKEEIERFAQRLKCLNESRHIEHVLFHMSPMAAAQPQATSHAPHRAGGASS